MKIVRRDRVIRSGNKRLAAAIVETALTLPIFFLVIMGIVEFGRAMMVSQLLTNSAREGVRLAIVTGSTNSECETAIKDFLTSNLGITDNDITVTITVTPAPGNPDPANNIAACNTRDLCSIQVQVNFDKVSLATPTFLTSKNLIGQCAGRHE